MKKFLVIMFVGFMFLTGCSKNEESNITFITLEEYEAKIQTDDKFMVVIGNKECTACQSFKPKLEEVIKNKDVEIFYIQVDNSVWTKTEQTKLVELTKDHLGYELSVTPTSFLVENKELKLVFTGDQNYSYVVEKLEDFGLVAQ